MSSGEDVILIWYLVGFIGVLRLGVFMGMLRLGVFMGVLRLGVSWIF